MRFVSDILVALFSAIVNLGVVALLWVEYLDGAVVIQQFAAAKNVAVVLPNSVLLHAFDLPAFALAVWANYHSARAAHGHWFLKWVVDFVPSLLVFSASLLIVGLTAQKLYDSGGSLSQAAFIAPPATFFVWSLYDLIVNQGRKFERDGRAPVAGIPAEDASVVAALRALVAVAGQILAALKSGSAEVEIRIKLPER